MDLNDATHMFQLASPLCFKSSSNQCWRVHIQKCNFGTDRGLDSVLQDATRSIMAVFDAKRAAGAAARAERAKAQAERRAQDKVWLRNLPLACRLVSPASNKATAAADGIVHQCTIASGLQQQHTAALLGRSSWLCSHQLAQCVSHSGSNVLHCRLQGSGRTQRKKAWRDMECTYPTDCLFC